VTVTIHPNACEPNEITVPAGRTTFTIVNQSNRALEWEILDGVMVVEERENIAPGFSQTMTVKLQPGEFAITCGS
jgi:iron uptake system component EfeO